MRLVLTVLLSTAVASCQAPGPSNLTSTERSEIAAATRGVLDSAFAAFVRLDADGLTRHFVADSEAAFTTDAGIVVGHDTIARFWRDGLATLLRVDSAALQYKPVIVLTRDVAVVRHSYRPFLTDTAGKQFWNAGAQSTTLARRGSEWKIVDWHSSHPREP